MAIWWVFWIFAGWAGEPFTVWKYTAFPPWQRLLFDFERESGYTPPPGPVWSPGCAPDEEKRLGKFGVPTLTPIPRGTPKTVNFSLDAPTAYIKNYFQLYDLTLVGRELTRQFRPLYENGKVPILFFSQEKKARAPGAVALCECEPNNKRIYVNKFAKAGLLAASLGHEIVHALDAELEAAKEKRIRLVKDLFARFRSLLEQAARRSNRRVERLFLSDMNVAELRPLFLRRHQIDQFVQLTHYRAERRAAIFENQLLRELRVLFPKFYSKYLIESSPSSKEIIGFYGFKSDYVAKYLAGKCEVPKGL